MAETVKGMNIKLGLDTTELEANIKSLNAGLKEQQRDLAVINKNLRYDAGNLDLWKQKQDKLNQVYNREGKEVLYDTQEKKVYKVANRSPERKKIEVFVPLQESYELISHSVPLSRVESNQISFVLEIEPQEEVEVVLEVAGKNLTSGFAFRSWQY